MIQQPPPTVVLYTGVQQNPAAGVVTFQANRQPGRQLRYRRSHSSLGIIQMVVGIFCFCLEVVSLLVGPLYTRFGSGIYAGVLAFSAGLLGLLAARKNNRCMIIACMVLSILAACGAGVAIIMTAIELVVSYHRYYGTFLTSKSYIIIAACVFEFVVSIVHASFTCATCCPCCWSRQSYYTSVAQPPGPIVIQQVPQTSHGQPVTQQPGPYQANVIISPGYQQAYFSSAAAASPPDTNVNTKAQGGVSGCGPVDDPPPAYSTLNRDS